MLGSRQLNWRRKKNSFGAAWKRQLESTGEVVTDERNKSRSEFDELADALQVFLINATEADMAEEIAAAGETPEAVRAAGQEILDKVLLEQGKQKMLAAKRELAEERSKSRIINVDFASARASYDQLSVDVQESPVTLAARKGTEQTDRDIESAIQDLAELGAFKPVEPK